MPTIDELAPATSASDSDEFIVSQGGIARKATRAQILNGVQPELSMPAGSLLGRSGTGVGTPQAITVGRNLSLNGSTLSATATPFVIPALVSGNVPASEDLIPLSQAGTAVAVTYGQLLSGISGVPNVDLSQGLVIPSGAATGQTLSRLAASMLSLSGGTLTGNLMLAGGPAIGAQAANKDYVDQQVAASVQLSGGSMTGILTLSAMPQNPLDSVTKNYADTIAAGMLPLIGGSLSGSLFLVGDPNDAGQAATKHYSDLKLARTGDTLTGLLGLAADPVSGLHAATKNYVDIQVSALLPRSGGTLAGSLLLASDPVSGAQASTKQYVDQRVLRSGDTLTGSLVLAADPMVALQAATKNYVDTQYAGSVSRGGSSMTGPLLLAADPATPLQAATKQYADLQVKRNGDTLTGALSLASDPTLPMQAATKQYADAKLSAAMASTGGSFTGSIFLAGDPTVATQAATKRYADTKLARTGDTLTGPLILGSDPVASSQAATKNYVDALSVTTLPLIGGSLTGPLGLSADPIAPAQASTKRYVDTQISAVLPTTGGSLTGLLSLAGNPIVPLHAATKLYVDGQIATTVSRGGGTLTGALTLAGPPTAALQAATKSYVDANPNATGVFNVAMAPFGAKLDGVTDDTAAFKAAYQAAGVGAAIYVPNGTTVIQQPGTWGIALTKRVKWIVDGTLLVDGTPLAASIPTGGGPAAFVLPGSVVGNTRVGITTSQGASQATDFAVNQSSYIVNHAGGPNGGTVIANVRADTIIYSSPGNYVWGGLDRLVWVGTQTPSAATPAQHVGRYIQTLRQSAGPKGQFLPQPQLWGACIEYSDTTGQPSSATNAALTIEMDWYGNGLDDANNRTIQSLVIGQHDTTGAAVEVANIIGVYLSAGHLGSAKTVLGVGVPFSNAVLDSTYATSINNAPVIKLSAGQAIAFEGTNSNRLAFDSSTGTLRWNQGSLSYVVGKGISVGWVTQCSSSFTLPNYISGNFVILDGNTSYTITLPLASTVAAGTGFTFSVTGKGAISVLTAGTDGIDSGPGVMLHANDRYHIVSDGTSFWHEVFWTNAVSPRFLGPVVLPSYTVANLPTATAGGKAFATNGRKPSEGTGSGTGVEVFFDGLHWISSCSGIPVLA